MTTIVSVKISQDVINIEFSFLGITHCHNTWFFIFIIWIYNTPLLLIFDGFVFFKFLRHFFNLLVHTLRSHKFSVSTIKIWLLVFLQALVHNNFTIIQNVIFIHITLFFLKHIDPFTGCIGGNRFDLDRWCNNRCRLIDGRCFLFIIVFLLFFYSFKNCSLFQSGTFFLFRYNFRRWWMFLLYLCYHLRWFLFNSNYLLFIFLRMLTFFFNYTQLVILTLIFFPIIQSSFLFQEVLIFSINLGVVFAFTSSHGFAAFVICILWVIIIITLGTVCTIFITYTSNV